MVATIERLQKIVDDLTEEELNSFLTERQQKILDMRLRGMSYYAIGKELGTEGGKILTQFRKINSDLTWTHKMKLKK